MAYTRDDPAYCTVKDVTNQLGLRYQDYDQGEYVNEATPTLDHVTLKTLGDVDKYWIGAPVEVSGYGTNYSARMRTTISAMDYSTGKLSLSDDLGTAIPTGADKAQIKLLSFFTARPIPNGLTYMDVEELIMDGEDWIDDHIHHSYLTDGRQIFDEYMAYDLTRRLTHPNHNTRAVVSYHDRFVIHLRNTRAKAFDKNKGDKLEVWDGNSFVDWMNDPSKSVTSDPSATLVNHDAWINLSRGSIHFLNSVPIWGDTVVKATYRIGGDANYPFGVPRQIKQATMRRVAVDMVPMERFQAMLPGGQKGALSIEQNIAIWTTEMYEKMARYRRMGAYTGAE
jgi:hypothetical protein